MPHLVREENREQGSEKESAPRTRLGELRLRKAALRKEARPEVDGEVGPDERRRRESEKKQKPVKPPPFSPARRDDERVREARAHQVRA